MHSYAYVCLLKNVSRYYLHPHTDQGGVVHIYTVGRSVTAVKLKVNSQFEIFSKVNGQATTFL